MPQVIEAPEAIQEERWYRNDASAVIPQPVLPLQRERTGVFAWVRAAVETLITHHPRQQSSVTHTTPRFELPIDRIAREHPFLFIMAMSG